ncbi:MAG: hypothetical protein L0207_04170, partial [Chlamydiae bacterium]|nr:hypothetical protein [Chlamydiota bacterium]
MSFTIELMVVAGIFAAISNLFMRRSIDAGGTTKSYVMIQFFLTFLCSIVIHPVRSGYYAWDHSIAIFGIVA